MWRLLIVIIKQHHILSTLTILLTRFTSGVTSVGVAAFGEWTPDDTQWYPPGSDTRLKLFFAVLRKKNKIQQQKLILVGCHPPGGRHPGRSAPRHHPSDATEVYWQSNYRLRQEIGLWISSVAYSVYCYIISSNLLSFVVALCVIFHRHIQKCVSCRTTINAKLPFYSSHRLWPMKQQHLFHQIVVGGYNNYNTWFLLFSRPWVISRSLLHLYLPFFYQIY